MDLLFFHANIGTVLSDRSDTLLPKSIIIHLRVYKFSKKSRSHLNILSSRKIDTEQVPYLRSTNIGRHITKFSRNPQRVVVIPNWRFGKTYRVQFSSVTKSKVYWRLKMGRVQTSSNSRHKPKMRGNRVSGICAALCSQFVQPCVHNLCSPVFTIHNAVLFLGGIKPQINLRQREK